MYKTQITDADVYLNEVDYRGHVDELDLGDLGETKVKHEALGMIGVLELPGRPVEAISGAISFSSVEAELEKLILNPTRAVKLQLHSKADVFDEAGRSRDLSHILITDVTYLKAKRKNGKAKLGDPHKTEHDISIIAFSQKIYGDQVPLVEFDAFNNIYRVNGEDVWED